jgi:hypothetical protein
MVTLAALGNIRLPIRAFAEFVRMGGDREMKLNLARFQRLEPYLPPRGHVGYLCDSTVSEGRRRDGVYQAMRAQYALAPHLVERFADQSLVIFDSTDPAAYPATAYSNSWELVVDLGDGLKLFRRPVSK